MKMNIKKNQKKETSGFSKNFIESKVKILTNNEK